MKKLKGKVSFGVVYLILIPVFAVIYDLLPEGYIAYSQLDDNILTNLYYSAVTITTLGFGDVTPLNEAAAVLVVAEAVLGVVVAGLFINQVALRKQEEEKAKDIHCEIARNRLRECDRLLQYAGVIKRIENSEDLMDAVRDFVLTIDMHDYRVLERICLLYISDGKEEEFRERFDREVGKIDRIYAGLVHEAEGQYWG